MSVKQLISREEVLKKRESKGIGFMHLFIIHVMHLSTQIKGNIIISEEC